MWSKHDRLRWETSYRPEVMALDSDTLKGGQMKSHVLLLARVLEDSGIRCCTSTDRDLNTITARVEHEGESFLTITLPTFGKDLEKGLDQGCVGSGLFKAFAKKGPCLPAFLQGFTSQVFDECTGDLLDEPSVDAIFCIRQISYLFKKLKLPCTKERVDAAFRKYVECDNQVGILDAERDLRSLVDFAKAARVVLGPMLHRVNETVYYGELVPKHGPGSTADRLLGNAKYDNRLWTQRLEDAGFYAGEYVYPSWSHFLEDETGPTWLEPGAEVPVKVVSVPKTLKTPRIIAMEPTHMQYVQQALKQEFMHEISRDDYLGGVIGFDDQEVNNAMACHGSSHLDLATLDLSEASDRVSNQLVRAMLSQTEYLSEAVDACRSHRADVPGHGIIPLSKFASMGSALTFPIEAMVFTTIVFMGIAKGLRSPLTPSLVLKWKGSVRVYGDDIIVPVQFVHPVIEALEGFGLVVNHDKSFWTGKFRESCGKDYYDGCDVSVTKVTHSLPSSRTHAREIAGTVELRNHLYRAGMWRSAEYLDNLLGKLIPFPVVGPDSPGLGRFSYLGYEAERECPFLQRPLVKAAVLEAKSPRSNVSGVGALLKFFLKRIDDPYETKHLERAGRPEAVNIKLRWVTPY